MLNLRWSLEIKSLSCTYYLCHCRRKCRYMLSKQRHSAWLCILEMIIKVIERRRTGDSLKIFFIEIIFQVKVKKISLFKPNYSPSPMFSWKWNQIFFFVTYLFCLIRSLFARFENSRQKQVLGLTLGISNNLWRRRIPCNLHGKLEKSGVPEFLLRNDRLEPTRRLPQRTQWLQTHFLSCTHEWLHRTRICRCTRSNPCHSVRYNTLHQCLKIKSIIRFSIVETRGKSGQVQKNELQMPPV